MGDEDLRDLEENIALLIHEELDTQHRLVGHPIEVEDCPVCASHRPSPS